MTGDPKDPTMQFPLAIQVCRRVVTTLEQMLNEGKEIGREHWESILQGARIVVRQADNAPSDADLVPRMTETVKMKMDPLDHPDLFEEPTPSREDTLPVLVPGKKRDRKKITKTAWLIIAACLLVLGVEMWMYIDLRSRIPKPEAVEQPALGKTEKTEARDLLPEPIPQEPAETRPVEESSARETQPPAEVAKEIPKAEAPGQPVPEGFGKLDIGFAGGWAHVYIDGKKIGTTPVLNYGIVSGEHSVDLRHADGTTIRRWKITLASGERMKLLHQRKAGKPGKKPHKGYGFLMASTRPWARVFIDDQDTGQVTPITERDRLKLGAGEHKVTFVTRQGNRYVYFVTIDPGEVEKLLTTLE